MPPRTHAYLTSPDGARGRQGPAAVTAAAAGAELYGLGFAEGLPGFAGTAAAGAADAQSALFGLLCAAALDNFRASSSYAPALLPCVETALRGIAAAATPTPADAAKRLLLMDRLKRLAQGGIQFCKGLDVEPYGGWGAGGYWLGCLWILGVGGLSLYQRWLAARGRLHPCWQECC